MSQRWVAVTLVFLAAAAVGTDVSRLQAPQGERYVNYIAAYKWPSDFRAGLEATRALLAGLDPYLEALPGAIASDRFVSDGVTYRYCYPPTHLLLYIPLALVVRDNDLAGKIWFHVMLLALLGLAALAWRLGDAIVPTPSLAIALVLVLIAIQPGTLLALERVQSDLAISLLCWSAVLLMQRERLGWAIFVAIAAALLKPYPLLFAAGFVAIGLERRRWRTTALATGAALGLLLAPVARYLPESVHAARPRAELFWASWQNWSLTDVSYAISHRFDGVGRVLFSSLCAAVAVACWLRLRQATRAGDGAGRALWLTLFTLCALEAIVGAAKNTYNYAMVLLLPGLVVVALAQPYLHDRLGLSPRARHLAGAWLTLLLTAFWIVRPWWSDSQRPLAGFAIMALVLSAGAVAVSKSFEPLHRIR